MTEDDANRIKDLLRWVAERDASALESLHGFMADRLFGLVLGILKDRHESEDVLQESFVKIWKKAGSYHENQGSPLGWLLTITRNTAYDRYRKRVRQAEQLDNMQGEMKEQAG